MNIHFNGSWARKVSYEILLHLVGYKPIIIQKYFLNHLSQKVLCVQRLSRSNVGRQALVNPKFRPFNYQKSCLILYPMKYEPLNSATQN